MTPAPAPAQASSVDSQLTWAFGHRPGVALVRADALLVTNDRANAEVVQKARAAIRGGEDHYMGFQFVPAAVALSEAADQLQALVGQLDAEQLKLLRHALLLSGSSWAEAKRADLAVAAFLDAQMHAGGAALDMSLVSPKAQPYWQQASNRLRARGMGSVAVESEPAGAEVYLDGELRGRTPLSLNQVPVGPHHLTLRHQGFDAVQQKLQVVAETPRQRFLMAERPAMAALKRLRHAAGHGGPIDDMLQIDMRAVASAASAQAVVVVGVMGGDEARVVLQRFARNGSLTHSVAVSLAALDAHMPALLDVLVGPAGAPVGLPGEALDDLDFGRGLLGQGPMPVADSELHADGGEQADRAHGPWQSVSVWFGVGNPAFSLFGPELRAAVSSSWGGQIFLFDAQVNYAHSEQRGAASLNGLGASVGVRARWQVWRLQLGGGLFAGAEVNLQNAPSSFTGTRAQLSPHGGALLRLDIEVAPQLFLGLSGYGRAQALRVQEAAGVQWQVPAQFGGLLGIGWLL